MQDYREFARKNSVELMSTGSCQFCGADLTGGVEECINVSNKEIDILDLSLPENHLFKFLIVDSHALQHPEIHGRWSNHFHLTRLNLILIQNVKWNYKLSPKLSEYLNKYKLIHLDEILLAPPLIIRGKTTIKDVHNTKSKNECINSIISYAKYTYNSWNESHSIVDNIAKGFIKENNL